MLSLRLDQTVHFRTPGRSIFHITERRALLFLILAAMLLRLPLVAKPFSAGGEDAWRETDTASIAHNYFDGGGSNILYPQINWGGAGPGYVETEFQLYSYIVSLLYRVFGERPWLGRLVSAVFSVLALPVFYLLARRLIQPRPALFALAFLVFSPLYIRYSTTFMPEATVFLFYVMALYLFQRWLDKETLPVLLLAAMSTALAVLVKPTSIHIGLIYLLLLWQRFKTGVFSRLDLWLFAAICIIPPLLWYAHARNLYLTYGNTFGLFSGGDTKFGDFSYWLRPSFYARTAFIDVQLIFALGGVPLFLAGIVLSLRKRLALLVPFGFLTVVIYYMIVARYAEFALQYHIYMLPYAALGFGLGFDWLFSRLENSKSIVRNRYGQMYLSATLLCLGLMTFNGLRAYRVLLRPYYQELIQCAYRVADLTSPDALIIVSTTSGTGAPDLENNYQEPEIFYFSHHYGWSLPADWHTPEHIEMYRREGASVFVIYDKRLLEDNPHLVSYLDANAHQIGPGIEAGCGIYRFSSHPG